MSFDLTRLSTVPAVSSCPQRAAKGTRSNCGGSNGGPITAPENWLGAWRFRRVPFCLASDDQASPSARFPMAEKHSLLDTSAFHLKLQNRNPIEIKGVCSIINN
jgi:hypothetical protein